MRLLNRIDKEKEIITLMIKLYCKKKHGGSSGELCNECKKCTIHCYKKDMREKVKEVMKFSGPRILIYNPKEYIRHIFK